MEIRAGMLVAVRHFSADFLGVVVRNLGEGLWIITNEVDVFTVHEENIVPLVWLSNEEREGDFSRRSTLVSALQKNLPEVIATLAIMLEQKKFDRT